MAIALFFLIGSPWFVRSVLLPRIGQAIQISIAAEEVTFKPFSSLTMRGLVVRAADGKPILECAEFRVRYQVRALLAGHVHLDELTLLAPVIHIVQETDGTSNLDPILKRPAPKPTAEPADPLRLTLRNLSVQNGTVRWVQHSADATRTSLELADLDLIVDQLANGAPGRCTVSSRLLAEVTSQSATNRLGATATAALVFHLSEHLHPDTFSAQVTNHITTALGAWSDLAELGTTIEIELGPAELSHATARFFQRDDLLGRVQLSGPINLARKEATLTLTLDSVDRQVLNLVGALWNLDFAQTRLDAIVELAVLRGGSTWAIRGRLNTHQFSLAHDQQMTPPVDLHLGFNLVVQPGSRAARIQTFSLHGRDRQQALLQAELDRPMVVSWADGLATSGDANFSIRISDLDLPAWRAVLGPDIHSGALDINAIYTQSGPRGRLNASVTLAGFTGTLAEYDFHDHRLQSYLEANLDWPILDLVQADTSLQRAGAPGGLLLAMGRYNLESQTGEFTLTARSLNQNALAPFLNPALGPYHLQSVIVNGNGTASIHPDRQGTFQALLHLTNFTVAPLPHSQPITPMEGDLQLDTAWHDTRFLIRNAALNLPPTPRASNQLFLSGHLDFSDTDPAPSTLRLTADALDLTAYADWFFPMPAPAPARRSARTTPAQPAQTAEPEPESEPDPIELDLRDFTLDTRIARLHLRETVVSNLTVVTAIDRNQVRVAPVEAALNSAPISARLDLDLGLPGWRYDLALQTQPTPLEPLVNSFAPAYAGQYRGWLIGEIALRGQGITGPSLRQHLAGQLDVAVTNANIQILNPKAQRLLVPIAILLRVPQLTNSPLDWLRLDSRIGNGQIQLQQLAIQSAAFQASTAGSIPIDPEFALSRLNLPVSFRLRRSIAERTGILPPNTPPDVTYASLPDFITLRGTLQEPRSELNQLAIGGLLLQSGAGIAERIGVKIDDPTSRLLRNLGDLLTGERPLPIPAPPQPLPPPADDPEQITPTPN